MTEPQNEYGAPRHATYPATQVQRPYGFTPADLLDPSIARSQVSAQSYQSAYGAPSYFHPTTTAVSATTPVADFKDIGKTAAMLVGQPSTVAAPGQVAPPNLYAKPPTKPQTTFFEGLLRGIATPLTGFLPPDVQQSVIDGIGSLGSLLSIPFSLIGNLPAVPVPQQLFSGLSPDTSGFFQKLPETEEKKKAEDAINSDPANTLYYMSQYLKYHEMEIAHGLGLSPLVADQFMPINNFGDQVMRTLGFVGLPQRLVASTWATAHSANIDSRILGIPLAALEKSRPDLADLRKQYESGAINHTEFLDGVTVAGGSFSSDPLQQLIFDIVSDPLNITIVGGVADKLLTMAPKGELIAKAVGLAMEGDRLTEPEKLAMSAYAAQQQIDRFAAQGVAITQDEALKMARDPHRYEWLMNNGFQDLRTEALGTMTTKSRALIQLEPVINAAAKMGQAFNAPFDLLGKGVRTVTNPITGAAARTITGKTFRNGERLEAYSSVQSVVGVVTAYGPADVVLPTQKLFSEMGADESFVESLGRMGANVEAQNGGDALTRMVREKGNLPRNGTPDEAARAMSEIASDRLAIQAEGVTRRIMDHYIGDTRTGPAAIADELTRQRRVAIEQLAKLIGPNADTAKIAKFVEHASDKQLAFINHMAYAGEPVLKSFLTAKQAARDLIGEEMANLRKRISKGPAKGGGLTKGQKKLAAQEAQDLIYSRATVIGPKTLTDKRARKVLAMIRRKDASAVREAVERYTILANNFTARGLTDEELLRDASAFLQDLLDTEGALVTTIGRDKLPPALRQWADDQKAFANRAGSEPYEVGLAPSMDNRWRASYDKSGHMVGVNAWVDAVADVADVPQLSALSTMRDRLFRPIRGERILEEARRDFRKFAVREWGLSRKEANDFFGAIRRRVNEAGTMPRGLTNGELTDLAGKMGLPDDVMQKLGQRGIARLVAKAFEGDTMTVGITQKISGKAKTFMSNKPGGNWLGVVAERLYPMARFTYNPIFLLQEAFEPFFWNIIKGIKPGLHWTEQDMASMESLRRSGFLGEWADQWEYSPSAIALFASQQSRKIAGGHTSWGQAWGDFIGSGRRVSSLAEMKRLNYIRNTNRNFARSFHQAMNELNPAFYDRLIREAGTVDEGRIANYYWVNKALHDPDNPHVQTWLMDATIPQSMGRTTPVNAIQLARKHEFTDFNGMRKAVKDGTYTEAQFRANMDEMKADPAYTDRAWNMTVHEGAVKWWDGYANAKAEQFGNTKAAIKAGREEAANTRIIWDRRAKAFGISEDEYLSRFSANHPVYLNSTGLLPNGSRFQMAQPDEFLNFYGHELLEPNHEIIVRVSNEARAVGTPAGEYDQTVLDRLAEKPAEQPSIVTEVMKTNVSGRGSVVPNYKISELPPGQRIEDIYKARAAELGIRIPEGTRRTLWQLGHGQQQKLAKALEAEGKMFVTLPERGVIPAAGTTGDFMAHGLFSRAQRELGGRGATPKGEIWVVDRPRLPGEIAPPRVAPSEAAAPIGHTVIGDPNAPVHVIGQKSYEEGMAMADNVIGQNVQEHAVLAHRRMASMFYTITDMLPSDLLHELTYKFIVQPFDLHMHRLRIEAKEAQNYLAYTADMLGADETTIARTLRARDPEHGANYYADNVGVLYDIHGDDRFMKGKPNSGLKADLQGTQPNKGYIFGWYDEKGDLVSTAWIAYHEDYPLNRLYVGNGPGQGVTRLIQPTNFSAEGRTPIEGLPMTQSEMQAMARGEMEGLPAEMPTGVTQPYVEYVGTRKDAKGKGYYNKMIDYIQSDGEINWADATGRGSYSQQGSPAAAAWAAKNDKKSLQLQREAIAARMLNGYTHLIGQRELDPEQALAALQGIVEMLGGRTKHAMEPAQQMVANLMDLSRYHIDPLIEMSEEGLDTLSEAYQVAHTWRQQETLNALTGKGDTIVPSTEAARAFGYSDDKALLDLERAVGPAARPAEAGNYAARMTAEFEAQAAQRAAATPQEIENAQAVMEAERILSAERRALPPRATTLEVTPEMHVHMRDTYRQWAAKANGDARLGRTDWTARDMQNLDLARYRQVTKSDAVPYDSPDILLQKQSAIIHMQMEPHQFSTWYASAFPNQNEALQRGAYGSLAAYRAGMEQVHRDVGKHLASWLPEASGVSIAHVSVGPINRRAVRVFKSEEFASRAEAEKWAASGLTPSEVQQMKDRGEWDDHVTDFMDGTSDQTGEYEDQFHALGHGLSIVVTGTDESIEKAVAAVGAAYEQGEVWATGIDTIQTAVPEVDRLAAVVDPFVQKYGDVGQQVITLVHTNPETSVASFLKDTPHTDYAPIPADEYEQFIRDYKKALQYRPEFTNPPPLKASGSEGEGWNDMWVTDFVISPETTASEAVVVANVDQMMLDSWGNLDLDPGRVTVAFPDGKRAIRVLHESTSTQLINAGTRPEAMGAEDFLQSYEIPQSYVKMMDAAGVTIERKLVRSYKKAVDLKDQQDRATNVMRMLGEQGSFYEPATGRTITKASEFGNEWDVKALHRADEWTSPWLQHIESKGWLDLHASLRNHYRGAAIAHANEAYWKYLPEFTAEHRALDQLLPPVLRGWHYQAGPRGIRAATFVDTNEKSAMFFLKKAGPDSALHETMHTFVPQLDDSMIKALADAYSKATGKRVYLSKAGGRPTLPGTAEEWLADQFVHYATTAKVADSKLQSAFNYFGKAYKQDARLRTLAEADPEVAKLFDQLLGQPNASLSAVPFDPDEYRVLATARYLLAAAEDAAHKTHYFARGRSLLERSVNHPYLGYYPASYMWGKVVPELVKFLIREPFGVKAPMWGYGMAQHVATAINLQLNTDQDFKDWVTNHPELIRFVQMMLPGTPWDIPVNPPAWMRHVAAQEAANKVRAAKGQPLQHADIFGEVGSSVNYALGAARFIQTAGKILGEGKAVPPTAPAPLSLAQRQAQLSQLGGIGGTLQQDLIDAQSTLAPLMSGLPR